jgi:hypothetical protein
MPKFSLEKPRVRKSSDPPPEPPKFIDVVELPTVMALQTMGEPWERVAAAAQLSPDARLLNVEYFKLSVKPAEGLSWLRDYKGAAVLYRQG